ncbi:DDB1- and CUL4-associated factor 17-like isoform X2 [Argopecten irradians]|uniref:DDB1- and CUL4-associated factor 17-like isoform X2 n=1 Tax=Argopecten irradians TaxID=31199 RepID=UPI00371D4204
MYWNLYAHTCVMVSRASLYAAFGRAESCALIRCACTGNYSYKKVWQKNSDKRIACEGGKIYLENFRIWYGGYNLKNEPKCLQENQQRGPNRKIENALLANIHPECLPLPNRGHKASLYCLEKRWLLRFVLDKQCVSPVESVFLSSTQKFSDLSWNEPQKSLVLATTHSSRPNLQERQAGAPDPIMRLLAVFELCPLKFVGMLKITQEVFGKDVLSATISHGLLITTHQMGLIKMYSFDEIVEKYRKFEAKLYEEFDLEGNVCGDMPVGLPCNIHFTVCPPVLFELRCTEHIVDIGGFPWHYLFSPPKKSCYHVCNLANGQLAKNGILSMDVTNLDTDKACFHEDNSGRIVFVEASNIRLFKLSRNNAECEIVEDFYIDLSRNTSKAENVMYTSSGRNVKRRISTTEVQDLSEMMIHNVDYEDELDFLYTNTVYHDSDEAYNMVNIYNNTTGSLLQQIRLEEPWQEVHEHSVHLDLDTIIKVVKSSPGKFCCVVYRLYSNVEEQENSQKHSTKHPTSNNRRSRR